MVVRGLKTDALGRLCSSEQLELLNSIDALRSQGIDHYVSLPQIIVCGDQSSGKSSVLEAISGVPFPVKSRTCTRFPIELILRRDKKTAVTVSIIPHHARSEAEKSSLAEFHQKLESFDELPPLVESAKTAMGIVASGKSFSKDLLRVEVSGPDRPHLTIVDLPGLIHSENKHQLASDVDLIRDVVGQYMKSPRSIILTIVSAKNDYANQVVLKLARKADKTGTRTLGIITKPDTLIPGSDTEDMFVSLAKNEDIVFKLGWHVLRNTDSEAESWALTERDSKEADFFSQGSWSHLPRASLGIDNLRDRLSKLLFRQIASELPNLMNEIEEKIAERQEKLDKLGQPRSTLEEQRLHLINISKQFQTLTRAAVDGAYNDSFFGDAVCSEGYQKRIRAVVQNLNQEFSNKMTSDGKGFRMLESTKNQDIPPDATVMTRENLIQKVIDLAERSRGRELPGMFNPMIVAELFREQSSPWEAIAKAHVKKVWEASRKFIANLADYLTDSSTAKEILETVVEPQFDEILASLIHKTDELLKPHRDGHPITYNRSFLDTLRAARSRRRSSELKNTIRQVFGCTNDEFEHSTYLNRSVSLKHLYDQLLNIVEPDMAQNMALEALDYLEAYYQIALQRFIDDVSVEIIESHLVVKLEQLIDPLSFAMMPGDDITRIAGETNESRITREELQKQLSVLKSGIKTCQRYAGIQPVETSEIGVEENADSSDADGDEFPDTFTGESQPDQVPETSKLNEIDCAPSVSREWYEEGLISNMNPLDMGNHHNTQYWPPSDSKGDVEPAPESSANPVLKSKKVKKVKKKKNYTLAQEECSSP